MDHNPIVNLPKAQVEAAAEILSDLTLVAIAGACGVDLSEPFDSEDAMRRLVDATTLGKNIREVVLIFNEFHEGDSTYTVAESLTSHYFRDYVKAKYTSETEHKGELLLDLLRTFLNPVPLYQEAYEYILHEVCDLEAKEQRVKLFRSAYDIAKDRFQEDHEVCLKLFNASRNLGDVLYSRKKNDSVHGLLTFAIRLHIRLYRLRRKRARRGFSESLLRAVISRGPLIEKLRSHSLGSSLSVKGFVAW